MMSSLQNARYALWHHSSQQVLTPLQWRETPRSKQLVSIVPSTVLPGLATVKQAGRNFIDLSITDAQAQALAFWLSNLPDNVLPIDAVQDKCISFSGPYCVYDCSFRSCSLVPKANDHVRVKVNASVSKIGPMMKANVIISDVLLS